MFKLYKLEVELDKPCEGANIHDYFKQGRIFERRWASEEKARAWVLENYRGADEFGLGCRINIVEDTGSWYLENNTYDVVRLATSEEIEVSTNASEEGWIEVDGQHCFAAQS